MKQIFTATIFLITSIILSCVNISACWCRHDPEETNTEERYRETISRLVESSDFVFSGTLVERDDNHLTFKIQNSWKGNISNEITFDTLRRVNKNGEKEYFVDSCSYSFETGKSYLVYANVSLEGLEVSICGRTNFLTDSARDVDELNRQKQTSSIFLDNLLKYKSFITDPFCSNFKKLIPAEAIVRKDATGKERELKNLFTFS